MGKSPGNDGGSDNLNSVASNEQLVFRSDLDGRSNNHTNDLLKDEILNKLNPAMYRQLFSGPSDESIGKIGKLIDEIPEEDCESSYGDEDDEEESDEDSQDEDEESKNSPSNKMKASH